VQAFDGGAGGMSVGAGVISDVYRPEQRGGATGVFVVSFCKLQYSTTVHQNTKKKKW